MNVILDYHLNLINSTTGKRTLVITKPSEPDFTYYKWSFVITDLVITGVYWTSTAISRTNCSIE